MYKERNLNLDIIRTVAVVFTITVHFVTNSGFLGIRAEGAGGFGMLLVWLISKSCVPLFLMLSGYLCVKKSLSLRYYLGAVRILVVYVFASVVCLLFEHFVNGQELGLRYIFGSIVNFYACYYGWYVSLYLGLFIMMPFLNAMYHAMGSRRNKQILILSFFAVSLLPSLLNTYLQLYSLWWEKLWPLTLYFTGAYFSEYRPTISAPKAGLLLAAVLLAFGIYDGIHFDWSGPMMNTIDYHHYQNYIISVLVFVLMLSLSTAGLPGAVAAVFRKISELSFAIYLLSSVSDGLIYPVFIQNVPEYTARYKFLPLMVLASFGISSLLAWLISLIYEPCIKIINAFLKSRIDSKKPDPV